ncbi:hypothetical protein M422DRAFT_36359, partial [Sphaerobolus stellatus SS14]
TQQIKVTSQTTNAPFEHNRSTSEHLIPLNKSLPGQLNFPTSMPGNFDDTNAYRRPLPPALNEQPKFPQVHSPLLPHPQPSHIPPSPHPPISYPITVSSPQIQPQREMGMENPFPSIYPDAIKINSQTCHTCTVKGADIIRTIDEIDKEAWKGFQEFSALIRQLADERRTHNMKTSAKTTFFEDLAALLDFLMHLHSHKFEHD